MNKKLIVLCGLIMGLNFVSAEASFPEKQLRRMADSESLTQLLAEMDSNIEASGDFKYDDGIRSKNLISQITQELPPGCSESSASHAADFLVEQALIMGKSNPKEFSNALSDFKQILGEQGVIIRCDEGQSDRDYSATDVIFQNLTSGYFVSFTVAWET